MDRLSSRLFHKSFMLHQLQKIKTWMKQSWSKWMSHQGSSESELRSNLHHELIQKALLILKAWVQSHLQLFYLILFTLVAVLIKDLQLTSQHHHFPPQIFLPPILHLKSQYFLWSNLPYLLILPQHLKAVSSLQCFGQLLTTQFPCLHPLQHFISQSLRFPQQL